MLPSILLKLVGVSLLIFGLYDTKVYCYALTKGSGTFDFFGRELSAGHAIVRLGFSLVLAFYYVVGVLLFILG
jgi:hypothetical protein